MTAIDATSYALASERARRWWSRAPAGERDLERLAHAGAAGQGRMIVGRVARW